MSRIERIRRGASRPRARSAEPRGAPGRPGPSSSCGAVAMLRGTVLSRRSRLRPGTTLHAAIGGLAAALLLSPGIAAAQSRGGSTPARGEATAAPREPRLFPGAHYFPSPVADLREPRMAGALIGTDLFEAPSGRERPRFSFPSHDDPSPDVQGVVVLGTNLPVWRPIGTSSGGLQFGFQVGVNARFRIERPSRDKVGTDWIVALPLEAAYGRWSGRLRLLHRSSHLGDELAETTGAERIEYSHEAVDALVAFRLAPDTRVYAGGTYVLRSITTYEPWLSERGVRDVASIQAGIEAEWPGLSSARAAPLLALDWQRAQRTEWDDELSAAAGVRLKAGGREFRLLLRFFDGPSTLGEFFLTPESFWGLELTADI